MSLVQFRSLEQPLAEDLASKMVWLGGPRQVGKTTLARRLMQGMTPSLYLNWDSRTDRKRMLKEEWPPETRLIVLDEWHKQPNWKSHLKGIWDTRPEGQRILVTGSSRLDIFHRGGDSMMGRYHYWRLHPFSVAELEELKLPEDAMVTSSSQGLSPGLPHTIPEWVFERESRHFEGLLVLGGFPEPLLSGNERTLNRWRSARLERLFHEDIRSVEAVQHIGKIELLAELLPARVGSPLSLNSLTEDVEVTNKTIKSWVELLARNYYLFTVPPWHQRIERALKKEAKVYLWDWSEVGSTATTDNLGPRFENLMASHLLKYCHYWQDAHGLKVELHYVRDVEKREVDFLITCKKKPWALIECKVGDSDDFRALHRFGERLGVARRFLVTAYGKRDYLNRETGVRVIPAAKFLPALCV